MCPKHWAAVTMMNNSEEQFGIKSLIQGNFSYDLSILRIEPSTFRVQFS